MACKCSKWTAVRPPTGISPSAEEQRRAFLDSIKEKRTPLTYRGRQRAPSREKQDKGETTRQSIASYAAAQWLSQRAKSNSLYSALAHADSQCGSGQLIRAERQPVSVSMGPADTSSEHPVSPAAGDESQTAISPAVQQSSKSAQAEPSPQAAALDITESLRGCSLSAVLESCQTALHQAIQASEAKSAQGCLLLGAASSSEGAQRSLLPKMPSFRQPGVSAASSSARSTPDLSAKGTIEASKCTAIPPFRRRCSEIMIML